MMVLMALQVLVVVGLQPLQARPNMHVRANMHPRNCLFGAPGE